MIIVTDKAVEKLKSLREGDKALRTSVIGGGCSGMSYKMCWVELDSISDNDKLMVVAGDLKIVIDPKSNIFLAGSTLDYSDDLNDCGFKWKNPQALRGCGCGASFSN